MLVSIQEARYDGDYRVWLRFNTGESGVADLRELIFRHKVAQPLRKPEAFQAFFLDEWPTLAWPCGYDIAPETLFEIATGKRHRWENLPGESELENCRGQVMSDTAEVL